VLGPFTMQLAPFCNVITFTAVAQGPFFNLSGVDDRCGGPGLSASGTVFLNPDGTAGGGLSIIGAGQAASQVALVIDPGGPSGTWSDNTGSSGTLVFGVPGGAGPPRPIGLVSSGGCPPDSVKVGPTCIDTHEASVWQTTDATVIQKIRLGTVTSADLVNAATQRGVASNDYGAAGCLSTGAGCVNVYAVSLGGVAPSRFINWYQAVAAARNAGKRLPTNDEWEAAAIGTPSGTPCVVTGSGPGFTGTAGCVSDVGAFDMVGNLSELTADFVPRGAQVGPAVCGVAPTFCIMERGGSFMGSAGPQDAVGSLFAQSSGNGIGFRAAR
jgi:hypothetical protein